MRKHLLSSLPEVQSFIQEKSRTQKEIADYFGVDRKTVRRAIDRLSIYTTLTDSKQGRNTVYKIEKPAPFEFTPLELSTLILAQESIIATGTESIGSPFAESAASLLAKVRQNITPSLRARLDAFAKVFGSSVIPAKDFSGHFETIELLVKAAVERRVVRLTYQNLSGREAKVRDLAPYNVYFDPDGATLKVIGHDSLRDRIIPFSIDHIEKVELLSEKFTLPADYDLKTFLEANCFNGIHGEPVTVRLRLTGITRHIFAERKFHPSQKMVKTRRPDPDTLTVELTVAAGRGLERFIQSWLPEIEVISPPDLRQKIRKNLRQFIETLRE